MGKATVLVPQLGSKSLQNLGKVHIFKISLMRTLDFNILIGQMKRVKNMVT